jgi:TetR/AcrR family transcriptional regulator, transcriptional repressor for nem operon
MSEVGNGIMDAAEKRMRSGGFNGFSFREIAADVGVKSSTVHYYFPTKEKLAAAVIHRYTERVSELMDRELASGADTAQVWTRVFRGTLHMDDSGARMCPCVVLGAGALDLPPEVAVEVKGFFQMCIDKQIKSGASPENAAELMAKLTGALVISNALGDSAAYDRATADVSSQPDLVDV